MTKQEKIQEAYGKNYNPHNIDENGWMGYNLWIHFFKKVDDDYDEFDNRNMMVRPNSLTGIENNNGWISIKDGEPKETIQCFVFQRGKIMIATYILNYNKWISEGQYYSERWQDLGITHYQPIKKPKPPIY